MSSPCPHIVIVGSMGVGKTTVGNELARFLDMPFLDSDAEIERSLNATAASIASSRGVEALHAVELRVFAEMAETPTPAVIAPAASVADSEEGRHLLARCATVWLTASPEVLARRFESGGHRRPVSRSELEALSDRRAPWWRETARLTVDTSELSAPETARLIAAGLDTADLP